ncbi:vomeronasal type-2 receptor 1-like [Arapaima gigas]
MIVKPACQKMILLLLRAMFFLISAFGPESTNPMSASSCSLLGHFEPNFFADGPFVIGGLVPMHYRVEMSYWNYTHKPTAFQCLG